MLGLAGSRNTGVGRYGSPVEPTNQEKARLARERVARELRLRGAGRVTEVQSGNVFELHATDTSGRREVTLRVKTKSSGDWQTTTTIGKPREEKRAETKFWILLDTGQRGADGPGFFVVPDWWMCNYVHDEFEAHLRSHGGQRPVNPTSTHCAIHSGDVERWRDRWDQLGIL
jgi:hypothetical protein